MLDEGTALRARGAGPVLHQQVHLRTAPLRTLSDNVRWHVGLLFRAETKRSEIHAPFARPRERVDKRAAR